MSSSLEKFVSLFDGSGYIAWAESMKAWLMSQGLWQVASGAEQAPPNTDVSMLKAWNKENDQAFRAMSLRLAPSVRSRSTGSTGGLASALWQALRANFGQEGPSQIYVDFKSTISIRVPVENPLPEMTRISERYQRLEAAGVQVPGIIQALLLLSALPKEYDSLASTILSTTATSALTYNLVRDGVTAEVARRSAFGRSGETTNKLSAVKRKENNPKWKGKQPSEPSGSGQKSFEPSGSNSKKKKRSGGKATREKRQKVHSHLASTTRVEPIAPFTGDYDEMDALFGSFP